MTRNFLTLLLAFLPLGACGMTAHDTEPTKSVAAGALGSIDVNHLLAGITDAKSAEAAKSPLESAIASLKAMLPKAGTTGSATEATSGMGTLTTDTLAKFGIDGSTVGTITSLLNNEAIAAVIGPTLNQLKSLLPL